MFLGKTVYFHRASLYLGVKIGTGKRCSDILVSALDSRLRGPGLNLG